MRTIDADTHTVETDRTWDFLAPSDSHFRPVLSAPEGFDYRKQWTFEGKPIGLFLPERASVSKELSRVAGISFSTPDEARELDDVSSRLSHMDELGIDIQVMHNTMFNLHVTDRPDVEFALTTCWNRWAADIQSRSDDRLRWSAVLPLLSIDEAVVELRRAVGDGACAVFMRPVEANRMPFDSYFFPIYEEAEKLNVPIGFHVGNGNRQMHEIMAWGLEGRGEPLRPEKLGQSGFMFRLLTAATFQSLIYQGVPQLFPKLRWATLEATARWLPFALGDVLRRAKYVGQGAEKTAADLMRENNFYVQVQFGDDLPYLLEWSSEDHLVIGTDYGHTDTSADIESFREFREAGGVDASIIDKMFSDNPASLYNI